MKRVVVPAANFGDIVLDSLHKDRIEVVPVANISEVWENALIASPEKQRFLSRVADFLNPKLFGPKQGNTGANAA